MKFQSKKLSLGSVGDDVAVLQKNLLHLGYAISNDDVQNTFFGESTVKAVVKFQSEHQLDTTGIVDQPTKTALTTAICGTEIDKPTQHFIVRGIVSYPDISPVTGLTVIAFDKDVAGEDRLGETTTDVAGAYEITYSVTQFRRSKNESRGADVFVRIYNTQNALLFQSKTVCNAPADLRIDVTLPMDQFVVRGMVVDANGAPQMDIQVRVFDCDLRSEQLLGESLTKSDGRYEIHYTAHQFVRSGKDATNLIARVFTRGVSADRKLAAQSSIIFNAQPVTEIDLTIPPEVLLPPTLFERIGQTLVPLLDGLRVEVLEEDKEHQDLSFLSGETGFEKQVLARFILSHRLAQQGIKAEFWFLLLGGSFYKLAENQSLKEQLTIVLDALPSLDAGVVHKLLTRGFNLKEIPETFLENVAGWIEAFLNIVASRSVGGGDKPTFVKLALEHAGIKGAEKQEKFARLFNEHKVLTPEMLDALEEDVSFKKEEIADLHTSFQIAELTRGDFSIVKMIKEEFNVRQPEKIRTLAKKTESEWMDLVKEKYDAGYIKLPIEMDKIAGPITFPNAEVYGKILERQFREAFPTTAFAGGLKRALQNGGAHGLRHAEALSRFLDGHETFDLLNTPVDDFLKNNIDPDFRALSEDENFRLEMKAVQRVFKLVPTFEAVDALLVDDLHSAQKIHRLGESEFVQRYAKCSGFTAETARLAWNRATDTYAAVLTVVADLKALENESLPLILQTKSKALSSFPNWNNLFKTGDLCECEHCNSVLGPAAYFADLLTFLNDRYTKTFTVKDILFRRRADLGYLELNCDNALTPLPYIDVVCEVLEEVVAASENDLELQGFTAVPAVASSAKLAVFKAFRKHDISLGADFSLSQVNGADPNRWVVHGDDVTYLLKKKATSNFFAEVLRNTKASAAELRAYPQYVNPKAYEKLRVAKYPLTLPFDLFADEVRTAFQNTNLQRWDLMRTLRGAAAPNNPTDSEIAAEYFAITLDEKQLILMANATDAGQQEIWGETGAGWLNTVGNVKNFLQKTGLEYNDLLALLDLKFINPTGDIYVDNSDDISCDTDKKFIKVLDAVILDRIHRFLRLWRKLKGWKLWELDLIIRSPAIGNGIIDEPFLINLFYFSQLENKLGGNTTVEQVLALLDNLNTETNFTRLHEKRDDGLYQNLFLNKKFVQPLDVAFAVDKVNVPAPTPDKIALHQPAVLAVLGIREGDLVLLKGLTKSSDGLPYITNDLTLTNLSFLWRHAWLSKLLKFKVQDWKALLKTFHRDILQFGNPKEALEFLENIDLLKATSFTPDELNWLLTADRSAKAAAKEADAAHFLLTLRKELQEIQAKHNPAQYDFLNVNPPTNEEQLTTLLSTILQDLNREEAEVRFFLATLRGSVLLESKVSGLAGFVFPTVITGAPNFIPIRYHAQKKLFRFTGLMTGAQRATLLNDASLAAVVGNPSYRAAVEELYQQSLTAVANYVSTEVKVFLPGGVTLPSNLPSIPIHYNETTQTLSFIGLMTNAERLALKAVSSNNPESIDDLFQRPRLAIKFYEPIFTAPLKVLPPAVNFKTQLPPNLSAKIAYDPEQQWVRFTGIMSRDEQVVLDALVPSLPAEIAYHTAVKSLATQAQTIIQPDERIWLMDNDLDTSQSVNDTLAKRLANAAKKALNYLSKTLAANAIVQQSSTQLDLTEMMTRRLMTNYAILPDVLLTHLMGDFAATTGVVDYSTLKITFDGWFWASRAATILRKWKVTLVEWEKITALTDGSQLLDFLTLPLNDTGAIPSVDRFLRTGHLLKMRDGLPETEITLLEVLEKLNAGVYVATVAASNPTATTAQRLALEKHLFAVDVQHLNKSWLTADMEVFIDALDLVYPSDYLLAERWDRLRLAFSFLDTLNASVNTVKKFAASAMTDVHAKMIKDLLRSKFGVETWMMLSAEIQDTMRERKRDALVSFLLTHPPANSPSGKWENMNDLYAYYLLDVEMSSCQLTSRLVQGSGSIQLFVQRCFMGLEPGVIVEADATTGDSAWRWWKWMRTYRVWEANRKVFLWPENWIEPELKKDRSSFFKDMENELLQNEINQYTAETAFSNYLEKLDGVAQLEIVGFYQEDDGDSTIVHVFGRTQGTEPHLYYYRRYNYYQWTPWEKVDLDIQGDYLIPVVVNQRLSLFWPVFTEVQDEAGNSTVKVPSLGQATFTPDKPQKRLRLQIAVSEYRQGKWTPKKVSKDFAESYDMYDGEIISKYYSFFAIDRSEVGGRFVIKYQGTSIDATESRKANQSPFEAPWSSQKAGLYGEIEIAGCNGTHELTFLPWDFNYVYPVNRPEINSTGTRPVSLKWVERNIRHDQPDDDFTLDNATQVLKQTPGIFQTSPAWHFSYMDKMGLSSNDSNNDEWVGTWLPFFYNDKKRTFFVLPSSISRMINQSHSYYPEIKNILRSYESDFGGQVNTWVDSFIAALTDAQRHDLTSWFNHRNQLRWQASYTDNELKSLIEQFPIESIHHYLKTLSDDLLQFQQFRFNNFYHPFVSDFAKLVNNPLKGISALMNRETQFKDSGFRFFNVYQPTQSVVEATGNPQKPYSEFYPKEEVDFAPNGAYSSYNWELFFHAPLLIANSLSKNQRFEEAREWYHFIFNPIGVESAIPGGSPMSKYWITKPFFETTDPQYVQQRIDNILRILAGDTSVPGYYAARGAIHQSVLDWRTNPFEPHRIANYRTVAYQKTVVMKYLDNLVAWGDYLFRQDSMESINEATQLYIIAAEILGPRPKMIPPKVKPPMETFNELEDKFDAFSDALIQVENLVPVLPGNGMPGTNQAPLPMLYFCIPKNDKMLGHWDTIADRLYKINHCMNIEGVVRQLALFEPPIDPGALVKAVAGGVDIGAALTDLNSPLPLYRFNILLQKANEVCNDVRVLGSALLTALEKKNAEALGMLRQNQEIRLLEAVKAVREKQIEEVKENLEGVKKNKELTTIRRDYYQNIEKINASETLYQNKLEEAFIAQQISQITNVAASIAHMGPSFDIGLAGAGGSPRAGISFGGQNIGSSLQAAAAGFTMWANAENYNANKASINAGHERRWNDWKFQESLANKELEQIDKSITAAELRIAIAERELDNHVLQIENAKATDTFMRSKYTNQELYQWQVGQISGVYFQSYKLAYDLAKRAEKCLRFELGLQDSSYINFGYWDSLKKGLLSGEKLQYDLRRLETAYLEQNRREFELTKHISLTLLDPLALVKLRETGRCFVTLPEEIFDLDYPGHYFRRIKSVSLTLPCVVGPYTTISCTLRLLKNSIRINTANGDNGYSRNTDDQDLPADDGRFIENNIPVKSIAASSAQNDSGVFELSFRDERYLPFEGAGTISVWSLELFNDLPSNNPDFGKPLRQFDYSSISDAILHIKYTAREDAGAFKNGVVTHLREYFKHGGVTHSLRMFNLRQEFPTQWYHFLNPTTAANGNVFELEMSPDLFPFRDGEKTLKVNTIVLLARCTNAANYTVVMTPPLLASQPAGADTMTLTPVNQYGGLHFSQKDVAALAQPIQILPTAPPVKWQLKMTGPSGGNLQKDPVKKVMEVEDVILILGYEWDQ